ncbi:DUF3737 family protein [Methanococcus voltae]|uniref:DUF3737 family protein n=1 Tax=Methanococcus voltae (strain ATCC BAA-1334 / A3) TaxID=456320 RepID=D7DSW7_METV3|nr:DUF3737 family protein [Methanococcus voltae]MCS3901883.1 hypothetical protein [Methanococcus voltae]
MGQNINDNLNNMGNLNNLNNLNKLDKLDKLDKIHCKGTIPLKTKYYECNGQNENIKTYDNLKLDEERALYNIHNAKIINCIFDGPLDGESALKESSNIYVSNCDFRLRYPFWHVENAQIDNSRMTDTCRAALWYIKNLKINNCHLGGIKALRECENVLIDNSTINSAEFGWLSHNMELKNTELESEYPFLHSKDLLFDNFVLNGKYSFQYVENVEIKNSRLNTKDAFWHSKNVIVSDSIVKGEYLGWYSENLKLIRCKIIGTQPLCYAKGLVLEDCEMTDCDYSFEYSDVNAVINGSITSVKNPRSGHIVADYIDDIIIDENQKQDNSNSNYNPHCKGDNLNSSCIIEVRKNKIINNLRKYD